MWFARVRLLREKVKMFIKTNRDLRFSSVANGEDNDNDSSEYRFSKCETKLKKYKATNRDEQHFPVEDSGRRAHSGATRYCL